MNPDELLRRSVIGVGPYVPGAGARDLEARTGRTDLIRLNWNENLFGPLPGPFHKGADRRGRVVSAKVHAPPTSRTIGYQIR